MEPVVSRKKRLSNKSFRQELVKASGILILTLTILTPVALSRRLEIRREAPANTAHFFILPDSAILAIGETVTAEVWLDSGEPGAVVVTSVINFDKTHLRVESITTTDVFANDMFVTSAQDANSDGMIEIRQGLSGSQTEPVIGPRKIAEIRFRATSLTGFLSEDNVYFVIGDTDYSRVASADVTWMTVTAEGAKYQVGEAPSQPDLRPYAPSGYPYPVVPSSIQGTHEVNTLYGGQTTYFDWHFINSGTALAPATFYVELWVDDTRYVRYPQPDFYPGWVGGLDDWAETISTPGWHTVRLITDPDDTVAESNESNNIWERQFYWETYQERVYLPLILKNHP